MGLFCNKWILNSVVEKSRERREKKKLIFHFLFYIIKLSFSAHPDSDLNNFGDWTDRIASKILNLIKNI
jgi:hypothetical protein